MKVIRRSAVYHHPIADVWTALTDPKALAEWLMPTTFAGPMPGHRFRFQYDPEHFCRAGIVECEVLECDAPRFMAWSWRNCNAPGKPVSPVMRVEWHLAEAAGGTRLDLVQTGLEGQPWLLPFAMGMGWRFYLRRFLPRALRNVENGVFKPGAIPLKQRAYRATNLPPEVVI